MNQYILEGMIYAMEKRGLDKIASQMMHNNRSKGTMTKNSSVGTKIMRALGAEELPEHVKAMCPRRQALWYAQNRMQKKASKFILALTKLSFMDISKAKRVGETAIAYAKRMKSLAATSAHEAKRLTHAKAPAMPSRGLSAGKQVAPKVVREGAPVADPKRQALLRELYSR